MTPSNSNDILNRLASSLENLLDEIKESQAEFATIKAELSTLHENVQILSKIVRDGDGNMSIITKIALLEQKIEDIFKWQDRHQETHKQLKGDISELNEEIDNLHKQILKMSSYVDAHDKQLEREEKADQAAIDKELELAHKERLSAAQVSAERQKLFLKIAGVVAAIVLTFLAGYLSNPKQTNNPVQHKEISQ